ncbi:MAG: hypothetical protein A2W19_05610 [Spirochaetes bacterium RBG_16_49_21]|nr:MAG: hypothetical protein A2W19_05610 [Spirochaetes bacterium RBG_16_49_21]
MGRFLEFRNMRSFASAFILMTMFAVGCDQNKKQNLLGFLGGFSSSSEEKLVPDNPTPEQIGKIPEATVKLMPPESYAGRAVMSNSAESTATLTPAQITATLKPGESLSEHKVAYIPGAPPQGDLLLSFDLTGSMGGELSNVKVNSINIMNAVRSVIPDMNFGVASHMDYNGSFSGCGYSSIYGASTDYPYQLKQGLTDDTGIVQSAINGLNLGYGADGPEDYTRVFFESYSDPGMAWRSGSKKIMLAWLDSVPHDCNFGGCTGLIGSTGPDPGRDEVVGTSDDLSIPDVLSEMAANNITLIVLYSGAATNYFDLWKCYAAITGGDAIKINSDGTIPGGTDVGTFIADLIKKEVSHIDDLTLKVCTPGFEGWLTSVTPAQYTDIDFDTPKTFEYDITITVPEGTESGEYNFEVRLEGDGVVYAKQQVAITVVSCVEGVKVRIKPDTFNTHGYDHYFCFSKDFHHSFPHCYRGRCWVTGRVSLPSGYTHKDIAGGEIVSIGGVPTSIVAKYKHRGKLMFSASEFAEVARTLIPEGEHRVKDVPVCVVVYFTDGTKSCSSGDTIDLVNEWCDHHHRHHKECPSH